MELDSMVCFLSKEGFNHIIWSIFLNKFIKFIILNFCICRVTHFNFLFYNWVNVLAFVFLWIEKLLPFFKYLHNISLIHFVTGVLPFTFIPQIIIRLDIMMILIKIVSRISQIIKWINSSPLFIT